MGPLKQLALLAIFATAVYAEKSRDKAQKAIGIFNIVKFNNDVCDTGNAMNGTCYTAEECTNRNGVASGSCADGYGVCCVITLTCGATTRENCTYLSQDMSATPARDSDDSRSCSYTICPVTSDVRRIRLELTTFEVEGPYTPTLTGNPGATANAQGTAIGHCRGDQFVAATGLGSSPIICGFNTGQHMILDTDGTMCVKAMFTFSTSGNVQRSYRIHNVQFGGNNDMGGPTGCLQYYTGEMGTVNSFNWNGVGAGVHLANQDYDVCIRQRADACRICWAPITTGNIAIAGSKRGSFGVSNGFSTDGNPKSGFDASCNAATAAIAQSNDFVTILGGNAAATNIIDAMLVAGEGGNDVFCGRYFNQAPLGASTDVTICSRVTPFRLGVHFDGHEAVAAAGAFAMEHLDEASGKAAANDATLGVFGFSLGFRQMACA